MESRLHHRRRGGTPPPTLADPPWLTPLAGYPPPKVACDEAGNLMESCLCHHCGGPPPPWLANPPWLADPPPPHDGWLGHSAFALTKRTC